MKALPALLLAFTASTWAIDYPAPTGKPTARTFPFSMIGQLLYDSGQQSYLGSGTVIRPRSVLTAAHNLYSPNTGWSADVEFRRSNYGYGDYLDLKVGRRLYVLGGYRSSSNYYGPTSLPAFSQDTGGIVFRTAVANGSYAGWIAQPSLLTGGAYNILLGYGADPHSGEELLSVKPTEGFTSTYGAFYENESVTVEHGMSGGPTFAQADDGNLYVAGVVVSEEADSGAGGIRVLNADVATFIRTYLP
jgi:V8-like Glu-specific endopeptidase